MVYLKFQAIFTIKVFVFVGAIYSSIEAYYALIISGFK